MLIGATDIIENFVLRGDLWLPENILLNYMIIYKDKAIAMWHTLNFVSRSAAHKALTNLTKKYKLVHLFEDGSLQINHTFRRYVIPVKINNKTGRPTKLAIADFEV